MVWQYAQWVEEMDLGEHTVISATCDFSEVNIPAFISQPYCLLAM